MHGDQAWIWVSKCVVRWAYLVEKVFTCKVERCSRDRSSYHGNQNWSYDVTVAFRMTNKKLWYKVLTNLSTMNVIVSILKCLKFVQSKTADWKPLACVHWTELEVCIESTKIKRSLRKAKRKKICHNPPWICYDKPLILKHRIKRYTDQSWSQKI